MELLSRMPKSLLKSWTTMITHLNASDQHTNSRSQKIHCLAMSLTKLKSPTKTKGLMPNKLSFSTEQTPTTSPSIQTPDCSRQVFLLTENVLAISNSELMLKMLGCQNGNVSPKLRLKLQTSTTMRQSLPKTFSLPP